MLNCGHSFCEGCLELLFKAGLIATPGALTCPSCLVVHPFPSGLPDLKKLIKNFTLLSIVEAAKGAKSFTAKGRTPMGASLSEGRVLEESK